MDLLIFLVVDALGVTLEELEDFFVFVVDERGVLVVLSASGLFSSSNPDSSSSSASFQFLSANEEQQEEANMLA